MSDARTRIGEALEAKLSEEQLRLLMDEVLAITKQGRGWCPGCRKQVHVKIPDAKAVSSAISDLLVQAQGRPTEQRPEAEGITFIRKIVFSGERDAT